MDRYLTDQEKLLAKSLLKNIDFLKDLPDPELDQLANSLEKKNFKPEQTVVFQGEISSKLYIVCDGLVGVFVRIGGEKKKVAELRVGDYFGEMSLLEPATASATIRAEKPSVICAISCDNFKKIVEKNTVALETLKKKITARKEASKPK
ncbi:MAG: cyclic nucleotide-binding domain-containing protein [Elusimicrobia bacterium]|nr:cyclic nucleotide-binding domain-containing protein [Elusimicrobiota bacterium]MBU2615294.1 cyclic nucleotide-binding domain-containing protein [Elusimicrobiota bacterium]